MEEDMVGIAPEEPEDMVGMPELMESEPMALLEELEAPGRMLEAMLLAEERRPPPPLWVGMRLLA